VVDKDFQISIESAKIRVGPFTLNIEQDKALPQPDAKKSTEILKDSDAAAPPGPDLIDRRFTLECKQCSVVEKIHSLAMAKDFLSLHAGHPVNVVP
jgi:hypothetical protein